MPERDPHRARIRRARPASSRKRGAANRKRASTTRIAAITDDRAYGSFSDTVRLLTSTFSRNSLLACIGLIRWTK